MGVITNIYEEDSDVNSHVQKSYDSECVISMESLYERLSPSPPIAGCGHRPSTIYTCDNSTGRSNSWPSGGGRRRGRRGDLTSHPHHSYKHDCVHNCGQPEPDTGQRGVELQELGIRKDSCGRLCCPKCGSSGSWNRSRMIRVTGHCILLLILASCAGFIVNSGIGQNDPPPNIADIVEDPSLNDIQLQPVHISDLKKQLQHTKNYYDFLRIFLTKKNVPNSVIDEFVNARTIQRILESQGKKTREYDDEDYDYSDEMAMDAEQERLDEELTDAWYHNEEMETSPLGECKTPQPEIVNVIDNENRNRIYLPECTVVYRCRNVSGCCGSTTRECGPLRVQVIERSFIVMSMFNDDTALPEKDMVEKRVFINHTECGCREKLSLPNCDKFKCPYPFSMMRKGIQCTCDCYQTPVENNYLCKGIKDGLIPLSEIDLACIKSGRCLKPVCTRGSLHVQSGHCHSVPIEDTLYPETLETIGKNRQIFRHKPSQEIIRVEERELEERESETDPEFDNGPNLESILEKVDSFQTEPQVDTHGENTQGIPHVRKHTEEPVETQTAKTHSKTPVEQMKTHSETSTQPHRETPVKPKVKTPREAHVKSQIKTPEETIISEQVKTQGEIQPDPQVNPQKKLKVNMPVKTESETQMEADVENQEKAVVEPEVKHDVKSQLKPAEVETDVEPQVKPVEKSPVENINHVRTREETDVEAMMDPGREVDTEPEMVPEKGNSLGTANVNQNMDMNRRRHENNKKHRNKRKKHRDDTLLKSKIQS